MLAEERVRFWRLRAEELRTKASEFKERIVRQGLLDAAEVYDRMADQAEKPQEEPVSRPVPQRKRSKTARRRPSRLV